MVRLPLLETRPLGHAHYMPHGDVIGRQFAGEPFHQSTNVAILSLHDNNPRATAP
jgi:hypothetical protein